MSFFKKVLGKGFQSGEEQGVQMDMRQSFAKAKSQKSVLEAFDSKNFNVEAVKEEKPKEIIQLTEDGKIMISNLSCEQLIDDMKTWIVLSDKRTMHGDIFPQSFSSAEAIDSMLLKWNVRDRAHACEIASRLIEDDFIEMCSIGTMRNVWKDGANYFYTFVDRREKKNISGMSTKELFKSLLDMIELKEKIERDDEIYYKCFQGMEAVRLMTENWDIMGKERALEIGKQFIADEMIQIASSELANAFKDTKVWYSVIQVPENREDQMIEMLDRFAVEYNVRTIENPEITVGHDYESLSVMQSKPSWFEFIDDLTTAIQKEFLKHSYKRQWERDAKLWRTTLKYTGTVMKQQFLRRIFSVLRFGPFFMLRDNEPPRYWYESEWPIAVALSHGSRIMIQTPPCYDPLSKIQVDEFWNWLLTGDKHGDPARALCLDLSGEDCEKQRKVAFKRLAATHGISTGVREGLKGGFIKYIKEERTSGISGMKVFNNDSSQVHNHPHWGCNVPLGGWGLSTLLGEKISGNGEHGHLYIYHLPAEENKCGGILIGLEGSEYGKYDQTGHKHNINATSSMLSPTFGFKWTYGKKNTKMPQDLSSIGAPRRIDGMFVDMTSGFDYIIEMSAKWNDDWVMETSVKPLLNLKGGLGYVSRELESDEKLEVIRNSNISSKEKVDLYRNFVRETMNKRDGIKRQLDKEDRSIAVAEDRIEYLNMQMKENWNQEDLLMKIRDLQLELSTLKKTMNMTPGTPLMLTQTAFDSPMPESKTYEKSPSRKLQDITLESPTTEKLDEILRVDTIDSSTVSTPVVDHVKTPDQVVKVVEGQKEPLEIRTESGDLVGDLIVPVDSIVVTQVDSQSEQKTDTDPNRTSTPEPETQVDKPKFAMKDLKAMLNKSEKTPDSPIVVKKEEPKIEEVIKKEEQDTLSKPSRIYYGNVTKKGEGFPASWNTRFFVLWQDGELEYYKDAKPRSGSDYPDLKGASLKGAMNVMNCRFRQAKGVKKGDLVLEIELNDRMFVMACENQDDFNGWKRTIQQAGAEFFDSFPPKGKQRTRSIVKRKDHSGKGRGQEEQSNE